MERGQPLSKSNITPSQHQTSTDGKSYNASSVDQRTAESQPSDFVDPAILSFSRSPAQTRPASKPSIHTTTPIKSKLAQAASTLPTNGSPFIGHATTSNGSVQRSTARVLAAAQHSTSSTQNKQTSPQDTPVDGLQGSEQQENNSKKKTRRGQKKKGTNNGSEPPPVMNVEVSRNGNDMNGSVRRGKGWRQTPLLQPSAQPSASQERSTRKTRRQQEHEREAQQNGWATEDATDTQAMGDFDFEANHKLFDKKQVFDQLRQDDTTADEDRLVSHNKLPRPGTHGGKNLHPAENVLSPKLGPKYNSNEAESASDADTELHMASGRASSRQSTTRVPMPKKQSSQHSSSHADAKPHPLATSISSERGQSRSTISLMSKSTRQIPLLATSSPRPERTQSPHSALSATRTHAPPAILQRSHEPCLAIMPSMTPCPVLGPVSLEIEQRIIPEFPDRRSAGESAREETAASQIASQVSHITSFDWIKKCSEEGRERAT